MTTRRRFLLPLSLLSLVGASACGAEAGFGDKDPGDDGSYTAYTQCLSQVQSERAAFLNAVTQSEAQKGPFEARLLLVDENKIAAAVKEDLKRSMKQSVESMRTSRIATARCDHLKPKPKPVSSSSSGGYYADAGAAYGSGGNSSPAPTGSSSGSSGAEPSNAGGGTATQTSTTNNQVAGVDEADFIKNDNKYIYVANNEHFRIIEAWPAANMHEIANLVVPGTAKKLFVEGNRAIVYSAVTPGTNGQSTYPGGGGYAGSSSGGGDCTYGYSGCIPSGDGTETEISIFDITDRSAPKLVRSVHSSSSLIAARRIGNAIHTVLGQPQLGNSWSYSSASVSLSEKPTEEEINAAYDDVVARNSAEIDSRDINILPTWTDSTGRKPEQTTYQSSMPDGASLTSVLSIDLLSDPNIKVESIISRPGWVYASASALYMAVPHQQMSGWGWYDGWQESELTTIHKFTIGTTPLATAYVGSGIVKGHVINQFAMDEKDNRLRVATSLGAVPNPNVHSTMSVMEDKSGHGKLEVVGAVDNIAPKEDIRSVRFDGDRGYIVTFKKTDPLFVFDLSTPTAPKVLGELKIPGFSTYMHLMDATHLLTIGYDASDKGDFAFFTGVLLQIFDVSNPADPKLVHKETIGTRGSSSEALTNHLAFNYFAPKNMLALPMTICEGGDTNGGYGTQMTFSGLMVYDVTVANGFSLRGRVAHPNSKADNDQNQSNSYGYYDMGCSNWWANATSEVRRSIFMDDFVYSVSSSRIKTNNLSSLSTDLKEVGIE